VCAVHDIYEFTDGVPEKLLEESISNVFVHRALLDNIDKEGDSMLLDAIYLTPGSDDVTVQFIAILENIKLTVKVSFPVFCK